MLEILMRFMKGTHYAMFSVDYFNDGLISHILNPVDGRFYEVVIKPMPLQKDREVTCGVCSD